MSKLALRQFDRVKRDTGRPVAYSVNSYTDAHFGSRADSLAHFLFRNGQDAAIVRVALEAIQHGGGLRAKRAIGKDFDTTQAQHVIAKPRLQSDRPQLR